MKSPLTNRLLANTNENSDTYAPKKQIIFTYEIAINNKFAQAIENHRTPMKNKNNCEINTYK
jgi:hypothetical protein